jgi:hypothetical protein
MTLNPERDTLVRAAAPRVQLSCSIDEPTFPSRPDDITAMTRNVGHGRSAATRSHAQQREHRADGEHRTFPAVSTVAPSAQDALSPSEVG